MHQFICQYIKYIDNYVGMCLNSLNLLPYMCVCYMESWMLVNIVWLLLTDFSKSGIDMLTFLFSLLTGKTQRTSWFCALFGDNIDEMQHHRQFGSQKCLSVRLLNMQWRMSDRRFRKQLKYSQEKIKYLLEPTWWWK